jgi:aminomethyltransferase
MPVPTPFHPRTSALCTSLLWKDWAGCHAVRSFDTSHEREYFALRHAAGLIDVSPLFKYDVRGPDAGRFLDRLLVRDVSAMRVGRVTYLCWCDDDGKVLDDGTVGRLEDDHYRVTAAEPAFAWLTRHAAGWDVVVEDATRRLGALAIQGPNARGVLEHLAGREIAGLAFFRVGRARIDGVDIHVSRTGYTGDLGYEIWTPAAQALRVWDAVVAAGRPFRLEPMGLDALDVARIEAGFVMNGVDYFSANRCLIDARKSSPFELGLSRAVQLDREPFIGRDALRAERARRPRRAFVGLRYDWDEYEALYAAVGLPPEVPTRASRDAVPVHDERGRQVGQVTSSAWSPLLKASLGLATVAASHREPGTRLHVEITVEYRRHRLPATVVATPFFDPPRKRSP